MRNQQLPQEMPGTPSERPPGIVQPDIRPHPSQPDKPRFPNPNVPHPNEPETPTGPPNRPIPTTPPKTK